ncbi:MAG: type II secretion system F family protein [Chitinispirillaceae bacterium]|nr:type II secretion system F family protein [Chitinispirillaceae bacterium]
MAKYYYKARDVNDRIVTGNIEGVTIDEVIDRLGDKQLIPIQVDELNFDGSRRNQTFADKFREGFTRSSTKVPFKEVVFFTRQLATMVEAGVPLVKALEQLAIAEKPVFKKIISTIAEDISRGNTFSDAVARHPGAFNNLFVSVCHAGEVAGALDKVLDQLATYMEYSEAMRSKVKSAMRYPTFIAGFVTLLVAAILWKLVPIFANLYKGFGADLPGPTMLLVNISNAFQHGFLWILLTCVLLVIGYKMAMTQDKVKFYLHKYILYIPVFGMIMRKNIWSVFSRTMALLMEAGTPILQATEICGAVVGNKMFSKGLEEVYANLRRGELLSASIQKTKLFPPMVVQLVSTGEESGKVDELLRKAAEFYEREIKNTVDSLAAIIEPFLIIILGGIVGGILICLYLPVFSMGKLISPH